MSEPRFDEQVMSQAVQLGLASQLDDADELQVDVRTDLLKAAQGQADSVSVSGQGMVVQNIRFEEMELHAQNLDINPLSMLLGKLELKQPLDAQSRLVLTEADLNQAINSDSIASRIPPLTLNVQGQSITVALQRPLQVRLPVSGKIEFTASALVQEAQQEQQIGFSVALFPRTDSHPLLLEGFQCTRGAISFELMFALLNRLKELLEQPFLQLDGVAFRVQRLEIESGRLIVQAEARVYQPPTL
ncbi:MAG TPA: DUF2993 domain-containing protein [Trichocoleus sp.]